MCNILITNATPTFISTLISTTRSHDLTHLERDFYKCIVCSLILSYYGREGSILNTSSSTTL